MADAQVFLRSAIIDENCLTVDMNDIAPHSTLFLTAVPLPYYHACATQLTYSKASSSVRPIQGGRRTSQQAHVPQLRLNSIRCTSDLTTSLYKSHVRPHLSALLLFLPAAPFSSSCHSFWCVALLCAAVERAPGDTVCAPASLGRTTSRTAQRASGLKVLGGSIKRDIRLATRLH
jgi:hypothetical protein